LLLCLPSMALKLKLFADDVKLYVKIVNRVDIRKLQLALSATGLLSGSWVFLLTSVVL